MEGDKGDRVKLKPPCLGETPWLMYTHGKSKHKQIQTFYSISDGNSKSYLRSIPQLRGRHIIGNSCGWLILQDQDQPKLFTLFNLATLEAINLPPLQAAPNECLDVCALTSSPDSHDSVLLLCFNKAALMFWCRPAYPNVSWASQTLKLKGGALLVGSLFSVNGVIHGICLNADKFFYVKDALKSLTLVPLQIRPEPFLELPSTCIAQYFVESCGHIYTIVLYLNLGSDIRFVAVKIYMIDLHKKIWVDVKCLDGRAFFLGCSNSCAWCWGGTKVDSDIQGNCLYLILPIEPECQFETLFKYNLLDQTWTILPPCPSLVSPRVFPIWVIPQQQRFIAKESKVNVDDDDLSQQNETQEGLFSKLPFHVVESIANYMHLFESWNFRASCKTFYSAFPLSSSRVFPFLMSLKNDDGLCTIMDPCRLDSRFRRNIFRSPLDIFTLYSYKNGWLLLMDDVESMQFFNLFSKKRGAYPPFQDEMPTYLLKAVGFSTSPTCSECLTVGIFGHHDFCYFRHGDKAWNYCEFDNDNIFCPASTSPVFIGGAFYFLDMSGYVGEFKLVDGQPNWDVYEKPLTLDKELHMSCIVECNGQLYSVFVGKMGNSLQVFKFEDFGKKWVQVHCLGNHILFVSRTSSFSVVTNDPKLRNRIYLPSRKGKSIVFYSLNTRKYHILCRGDTMKDGGVMENLHFTKESMCCYWI